MRTSLPSQSARAFAAALSALVIITTACTSNQSGSTSSGPSGGTKVGSGTPASLGFVPGAAENADGAPPEYTATSTCGSDSATYLAELATTSPDQAKVPYEWADVVPGGKQIMVTGTMTSSHLGPQDLPMSHTFGDDLSMNIRLDPQFTQFAKQLGHGESEEQDRDNKDRDAGTTATAGPAATAAKQEPAASNGSDAGTEGAVDELDNDHVGEDQAGFLHVEISAGLIPHVKRPANGDAQTWRALSDFNLTGFQPGLKKPAVGDRVAIMGRWIVDCGHGNYGTELHAISFLAWTHTQDARTDVHFYMNPFRDSEIYSPDADSLGHTGDSSRFSKPNSKPFPGYFLEEVVRLLQGKTDHLRSSQLIDATIASPADWIACAAGGGPVSVSYDIVTRPGAAAEVSTPDSKGCVTVHSVLLDSYRPADAALHTCALPWTYLDKIAQGAVAGTDSLDVVKIIEGRVPSQYWDMIERNPTTSCGDALAGPTIAQDPTGQHTLSVGDQPFPYYGTITLTHQG